MTCPNFWHEHLLSAAIESVYSGEGLFIFNNAYLSFQGSGGLSHYYYYSNSSLKTERIKSILLI